MMFDNSPPESPSPSAQVKAHLPMVLAVGGFLTLFVSLHTGAVAIAGAAAAHVALGLVLLVVRRIRNRDRTDA